MCQEILQTLLDNKHLKVLAVTPQYTVTSKHREIVLDVLCELDGELINIEVQKGLGNHDIKRTRFHLSSITANATPKGTDFGDIPNVTVIYITEYDALKNHQVFTLSEMCIKNGDAYVPVKDGGLICYANTEVKDDSDKSEMLQLFLKKDVFYNSHFPKLSNRVKYFKDTEKGREEMCDIVENYAHKYAEDYAKKRAKEAKKQGMQRGMKRGIHKAYIDMAKKLIIKGMDDASIHEITNLPLVTIEKLRAE